MAWCNYSFCLFVLHCRFVADTNPLTLNERRNKIHFQIYLGLLILMAISLSTSKAMMSIVPGFLMVNWLAEGQFAAKMQRLKDRKSVALLVSVFLVYLLGLVWTNNLESGLRDVKIQLPLLVLPLVIGTSATLNYRQIKSVIYFFSAAVVVASFISIWVLLGFSGKIIQDTREMSLFISHIRFALLVNISIFSLGWFLEHPEKKSKLEKAILLVTMVWLAIFLIILKSATGWVVFLIVSSAVAAWKIFSMKNRILKIILGALLISVFAAPIVYIGSAIHQFYQIEKLPADLAAQKTNRGNLYAHDFNNRQMENGNYTFWFMNIEEMREAWNRKSKMAYDSTSASGFNQYVLIRYLTSKGLRKDAEGVNSLTENDIRNIENGMTNYRFENSFPFYKRIYQIIWEFDVYRKGGNPSGHSVTQRIEYYKIAFGIIGENFWFGTGTGGYAQAYKEKYDQNPFFKDQKYRQRSHNMFLSYWIDFGIIGLLYICFALFSPIFLEQKTKSYLVLVFMLIVFLSFLNEDSLNNHDAISFFAFLYPLFLYSNYEKPLESSEMKIE